MSVSIERAALFVNVDEDNPLYGELAPAIEVAQTLISADLGDSLYDVPEPVMDMCTLIVVGEIWKRQSGADRISYGENGEVIYLANDMLRSVRPMYSAWRGVGGIA